MGIGRGQNAEELATWSACSSMLAASCVSTLHKLELRLQDTHGSQRLERELPYPSAPGVHSSRDIHQSRLGTDRDVPSLDRFRVVALPNTASPNRRLHTGGLLYGSFDRRHRPRGNATWQVRELLRLPCSQFWTHPSLDRKESTACECELYSEEHSESSPCVALPCTFHNHRSGTFCQALR